MKTTFVYTISDESGIVRYIGKSNNPRRRLYQHINEKSNIHKYNWIKSIIKGGSFPIIEILDEVPVLEWEYWERYWILQFKLWGFNLLNLTSGGEGASEYKHTNESKQRMRISKLGTKLPEEQKQKISESVKRKAKEDPNYNKCQDKSNIIDKDDLYQKYMIENLSLNKCASYFRVSKRCIFDNITEHGFKKDKSKWINQVISNPEKTILQFSKDGVLIREWVGLKSITREIGINSSNIANCCRGVAKSAGGFIWKYK